MVDREKVKKGLICCREMDNPPGWRVGGCLDCPYESLKGTDGCCKKLKEDALDVMKEFEEYGVTVQFPIETQKFMQKLADRVLDEFAFKGKTIREWAAIIVEREGGETG